MKYIASFLTFLLMVAQSFSQPIEKAKLVRTIEVTGSAEMSIDPDIIKFTIVIQEYWEEEFQPNKEYKDYKTKVPISKIENNLLNTLYEIGFDKEDIILKELGNYWRHHGKEFLIRKEIEINIDHFDQMQAIANKIDTKGIQGMRISEVNHTEIAKYRKQIKKEALLAAQDKAQYLVEGIGEELGRIVTIQEISDGTSPIWHRAEAYSNMMLKSADQSQQQVENFKKMELRYEIRAVFEIKE